MLCGIASGVPRIGFTNSSLKIMRLSSGGSLSRSDFKDDFAMVGCGVALEGSMNCSVWVPTIGEKLADCDNRRY